MSSGVIASPGAPARATASGLHRRQAWTVALLFAGYAAYYFCRSDLSVAMPLLIEDLHVRAGAKIDHMAPR